MPTVLIVSPHFPPSTLAGVHRARHLARHLPAFGWRPIIVRTHERHYSEMQDPGLAALVPESVEQIRTGALPERLTRLVGIGDIGLRGLGDMRRGLLAACARNATDSEHPVQAVMITGAPFYPMMLARSVKQRFDIPVVLDFQDPWVSPEGAARSTLSKRGIVHSLAVTLEPRALHNADFVTSVSEVQNLEMAARYPWLDAARMAAIPIGGDPDDFDMLRRNPPPHPTVQLDESKTNLSYVGTFLPRAGPLMRQVFRALRALTESKPRLAEQLRLNFVGTSNQPGTSSHFPVTTIAEEEGVQRLVSETPGRVPFLEALSLQANSNGLLLIGSDEPHYTASKIYPVLMSQRPYVSLFHAESSAHAILRSAGGGRSLSFTDVGQLDTMTAALGDALERLATLPDSFGRPDPEAYAPYTASNVAGRYAEILSSLAPTSNR
ncbi:MAG: glycosyltransferase family 4 protein [bacterium]|nr:glycosyltransferase family 4 protein [bacterium]